MPKEAWLLCSLLATLFVVISVADFLLKRWKQKMDPKADHHFGKFLIAWMLRKWVSDKVNLEHAEAHLRDYQEIKRKERRLRIIAFAIMALAIAVHLSVCLLIT